MKNPFLETGAEYASRLFNSRVTSKPISLPGFPEHIVTEVHSDDSDASRIVALGTKACEHGADYVLVSFSTTDTPLDPAHLLIGEVILEDDTI